MKKYVTIMLSLVSLAFLGNCQKSEPVPGVYQNEAQADQANPDQAPKKNATVRKDDDPDNVKDAFKKAGREIKEFFVGKDNDTHDDD